MKTALVLFAFATSISTLSAAADLSQFSQAEAAFKAGHAPTAKTLGSALWMVTSVANEPSTGAVSGLYPNGAIPDGQGTDVRQIAGIQVTGTTAVAKFNYTDARIGIHLGSNVQSGRLTKKGLELYGPGDAQTCSTKSICRELVDHKTLLCAQVSDDARAVCTRSYKRGDVSAYLGYAPVHP